MTPEEISNLTVSQIKIALAKNPAPTEAILQSLDADTRTSVRQIATQIRRRQKAQAQEKARLEQMCALENKLRARGLVHIAGVDEAGRGPLAGPVVAAAVIFDPNTRIDGLNDSKKLSHQRREVLFDEIQKNAIAVGVGQASAQEIDTLNIRNATHLAMRRALENLAQKPDRVLIDGNAVPESPYPEMAIIGGDRKSLSIAAASIMAKVTRDRQMLVYDAQYPQYGFATHKGYGSTDHLFALRQHGPCPIHRLSFGGVPPKAHSEDFEIFAEGIQAANTVAQLEAMGNTIASASSLMPADEVQILRDLYTQRRNALSRPGKKGEQYARAYLIEKGYQIVFQNYRAVGGEIDIIARKNNVLSFVEVKTASQDGFGTPETWVTPQKQVQIIRIARFFLTQHPTTDTPRFDVVAIHLTQSSPEINHIKGAFSDLG